MYRQLANEGFTGYPLTTILIESIAKSGPIFEKHDHKKHRMPPASSGDVIQTIVSCDIPISQEEHRLHPVSSLNMPVTCLCLNVLRKRSAHHQGEFLTAALQHAAITGFC